MKICLVNTFYYPDQCGGAELSVKVLADSLVKSGHDVFVITTGHQDKIEVVDGVRIYRISIVNIYSLNYRGWANNFFSFLWHIIDTCNYPTAWKVAKILRRESPNIVHTNNLKGISVAIWPIAKRLGLKVVHTLRDYYLLCPKGTMFHDGVNCAHPCFVCSAYNSKRRQLSSHVDVVVGNSNFILQRHLNHRFFSYAQTHVCFNGYNKALVELSPTSSGTDFKIGYIGRIGPFKGIELLLEAFCTLVTGTATLYLAGSGEQKYEASLRERYNSPFIVFEGFVRPEDFLSRIDVLVVPSLWHEPLPRVVFEGYAYGVPTIAARRGGIPEIVEHEITGLLFDPSERGSLANAIHRFMDPVFREPMREAAFRKSQEFKPERIIADYLNVYKGQKL